MSLYEEMLAVIQMTQEEVLWWEPEAYQVAVTPEVYAQLVTEEHPALRRQPDRQPRVGGVPVRIGAVPEGTGWVLRWLG